MNAARVAEELRAYFEANSLSQMEVSRRTGIPQPTLSRALKNPVRITNTHRRLCTFANISLEASAGSIRSRQALIQAVLTVWDGTPEHAQSIARLLNAGSKLEAHATARAVHTKRQDAAR